VVGPCLHYHVVLTYEFVTRALLTRHFLLPDPERTVKGPTISSAVIIAARGEVFKRTAAHGHVFAPLEKAHLCQRACGSASGPLARLSHFRVGPTPLGCGKEPDLESVHPAFHSHGSLS